MSTNLDHDLKTELAFHRENQEHQEKAVLHKASKLSLNQLKQMNLKQNLPKVLIWNMHQDPEKQLV